MSQEIGRNDPCPCGSGKKYKSCCWIKKQPGRRKFSARVISGASNIMGRSFSPPPPTNPEGPIEGGLKSHTVSKGPTEPKEEGKS